jgi:hypothetical protein
MKEKRMRRLTLVLALLFVISTLPALGDERAPNVPSLRDRAVKIVKIIKKIVQDLGDMSVPHP